MSSRPIIITIDGPAGSGKTTIARELASALGFTMLDTGAIYRSLALIAIMIEADFEDEASLVHEVLPRLSISFKTIDGKNRVFIHDDEVTEDIRKPEVSALASKISAFPRIRSALLNLQRGIALESGSEGVVLEGRDTGTVVFPDADIKIFLTASEEERARRRFSELESKGLKISYDQVAVEQAARDEQDRSRRVAPLVPASDAYIFDSTGMKVEEVISHLKEWAKKRISKEK